MTKAEIELVIEEVQSLYDNQRVENIAYYKQRKMKERSHPQLRRDLDERIFHEESMMIAVADFVRSLKKEFGIDG